MIGYIEGKVIYIGNQSIIVNVSGVGYRVFIGSNSFTMNESVKLFIYTNVSEREISLIGFKNEKQLDLFHMLLDVNGVGPKLAHKFITELGVENVIQSIVSKDEKSLKIPGAGAKTALKIIIELKDVIAKKYPGYNDEGKSFDSEVMNEAKEGLKGLGYTSKEIDAALNRMPYSDSIDDAQSLIKSLLRHLK